MSNNNSRFPFAAAACVVAASLLTASAAQAADPGTCPTGRLTLARIAAEGCVDRIPLPVLRPTAERTAVQPVTPSPTFEYAEVQGSDGRVRKVRLVGPRFLPDEDQAFAAAFVSKEPNGWDVAVQTAIGWFGVTSAHAEGGPASTGTREEAAGRAGEQLLAAR